MAKSQGITVSPPAQQQGSKNVQTGRPQNILTLSLTKGNTTYDEFKHMMAYPLHPINGGEAIALMVMRASMEKELRLMKTRNIMDKEKCESGKEENISSQGTDLLMAVRKRSLEEGQKALKLGVFRGYGAKKLGRRERALLL
ncbi:unnamed protein product [Prunus armeniaca]